MCYVEEMGHRLRAIIRSVLVINTSGLPSEKYRMMVNAPTCLFVANEKRLVVTKGAHLNSISIIICERESQNYEPYPVCYGHSSN